MTKRKAALVSGAAFLALLAALLGSGQSTAEAGPPEDAVLDWNLYASQALINAPAGAPVPGVPPGVGQPPPVSLLHLGMVQGAVYDAVNMIDGGHEPYSVGLPTAPSSASKAAAVATAAHDVLTGMTITPPLTPAIVARLDGHLADSIAAATSEDGSGAVADGIAAGAAAADAMLAARASDGRYTPGISFTEGTGVGEWRPTSGVNDPNAWVRVVDPFVMTSASQFRTDGPTTVGTRAYRKEYNEVKDLGGNGLPPPGGTPTLRTAEQTQLALFFQANPVEMYNRAFRGISTGEGLTLVEQARLFAMLNLSGADAAIGCWDDKEHWAFWRPITAIRQDDGDPKTVGDTNWTSMVTSPPYPDHPSGYNCVTGAFMHAGKAFFGKGRLDFALSPPAGTPTRSYTRFTDVIDDTIDARIYQGLHFRSADEDGAWLGKKVARWLDKHYLEALDDDDDDEDEDEDDDD